MKIYLTTFMFIMVALATFSIIFNIDSLSSASSHAVDNSNSNCDDSIGTPFCTIQAAVDAAFSNDNIDVAAGIYVENVIINKDLVLRGSEAIATIIDGNHVDTTIITNADVMISHITIQNGDAVNGGGVFNQGNLTLSDSVIRNNISQVGGGIRNNGNGKLALNNVNNG